MTYYLTDTYGDHDSSHTNHDHNKVVNNNNRNVDDYTIHIPYNLHHFHSNYQPSSFRLNQNQNHHIIQHPNRNVEISKYYNNHQNDGDDELISIAERFSRFCKRNKFSISTQQSLPSSCTVKQFRRYDPNIDALLLASYGSEIRNPYFHSLFDSRDYYDLEIIVKRLHVIADLVSNVSIINLNRCAKS